MLFNTYEFAFLFFPIVYLTYRALPLRPQNVFLLAASYFFYGWWDWRFLSLILISTVIDYFIGRSLAGDENPLRRRVKLTASIVSNLGILAAFKYFDFFAASAQRLLNTLGFEASLPVLNVVLPVGISFYTFQTLSYTIDIYRRQLEPTRDFLNFALFVAYFPQLVAGPIERARNLLPQIEQPRTITGDDFATGMYQIFWGLFLKVVIADNLAPIVDTVFSLSTEQYNGLEVTLGLYAFAFQIYCDFAGYSYIARGLSRCMGITLMLNFNLPYLSKTPSEFWQRWHISLSTWLRDYLYIPLGGNRHGKWRTYGNLMMTMGLGGLWHGASWTFIAWGLYQGAVLVAYRPFESLLARMDQLLGAWSRYIWHASLIVVFFHITCIGWLWFRAEYISQAFQMLGAIFDPSQWQVTDQARFQAVQVAALVLPLLAYQVVQFNRGDLFWMLKRNVLVRALFYSLLLTAALIWGVDDAASFIYFQF